MIFVQGYSNVIHKLFSAQPYLGLPCRFVIEEYTLIPHVQAQDIESTHLQESNTYVVIETLYLMYFVLRWISVPR